MKNTKINKIKKEYFLSVIFVFSYFLYRLSNALNINNANYAIEQINKYDNSLFNSSLLVNKSWLSPRFFMNILVSVGMKLTGGNWANVAIPLIYIGLLVYAIAITEIVFNSTIENRFALIIILSILISKNINTGLAGWGVFSVNSLGMSTGMIFAILAISQVIGESKKWNKAWIFLSIAALCHVHEGIWGFGIIFIIILSQILIEKDIKILFKQKYFILYFIVLAFCVLPGLFGEKSTLTAAEFVQIYAIERLPHHLVPSTWGIDVIAKYSLIILFSAIIRLITIYKTNKANLKEFLVKAFLFLLSWTAVLVIEYIVTEILPISSIVTMYLPKYLKYVSLVSLIWCIEDIRDWINEKEYYLAATILVVVYVANYFDYKMICIAYGLLCILLVLVKLEKKNLFKYSCLMILAAYYLYDDKGKFENIAIFSAVLFICFLSNKGIKIENILCKPILFEILSVCLLVVGSYSKVWTFQNNRFQFVNAEQYVIQAAGTNMYSFAKEFKDKTDAESEFVCDSQCSEADWFQLISERTMYVNFDQLPSSQLLIEEWHTRNEIVDGLCDKSIDDIEKIMKNIGINYIYVDAGYFEKFDTADNFENFVSDEGGLYRIYRLK